jgi:hypothetical protein
MGLASDEGVSSGICQTESKAAADRTAAFSVVAVDGARLTVADRPRLCQNPNHLPCRFGSARFESTKSGEIEPTCPKMHCTIGGSRVFTLPSANTGTTASRNACPKADVAGGPAARWLPLQIASANMADPARARGHANAESSHCRIDLLRIPAPGNQRLPGAVLVPSQAAIDSPHGLRDVNASAYKC